MIRQISKERVICGLESTVAAKTPMEPRLGTYLKENYLQYTPQTLVHLKQNITEEIRRIDTATLEEDEGKLGFSPLSIVAYSEG